MQLISNFQIFELGLIAVQIEKQIFKLDPFTVKGKEKMGCPKFVESENVQEILGLAFMR